MGATDTRVRLGTGIGWRPEIADGIEALPGIDWVEVVAENICPCHLPDGLRRLRERGTTVVPHGVSLGLGGAELPDPARLSALAERAEALGAPLVTEHIAFVRAGGPPARAGLETAPGPAVPRVSMEAGHLLPVPRTRDALDVLCENVRVAQEALPVPLALENIAALVEWPGEELSEGEFLAGLVERTGVRLLIDVANLHTNHVNRGEDPATALGELPLDALAYVHVAGGFERDGVWHDSHGHPVPQPVLDVLAQLCARTEPPGVLLERDENFPPVSELADELGSIRAVLQDAAPARELSTGAPAAPPPPPVPPTPVSPAAGGTSGHGTAAARERLARAQADLLAALVAGAPAPEGFDSGRLAVQSRALAAKRADVVAKVAPELPL
ncbi:endonuclease, partial [Streptomyces abyssalis]